MRVAVIGMGHMGRSFAGRALARGHQVTVWNRSPGKASDLVARGAVEADSPQYAVDGVDVAFVVLADDAAVLNVCAGENGTLASLGPSTVLANVSTVSPTTIRRIAEIGPSDRILDAPVMGSPENVANGHARFLVGGPAETIAALDPLWDELGSGYIHCGPIGSAAIMKLISNLLLITGVTALAEAIATARQHDISDEFLRKVFANSPVVSPASATRLDNLLDDSHPGWFTPALARKDLRLAIALAEESGVGVRIGPATDELLTTVIEGGHQWPDFSAVIEALS
jgi:3-hydroxyisobutyrate dehydrogenase-like beta-hydroxyacid dehydrogenase